MGRSGDEIDERVGQVDLEPAVVSQPLDEVWKFRPINAWPRGSRPWAKRYWRMLAGSHASSGPAGTGPASRSTTSTSWPSAANISAAALPLNPAPMTITLDIELLPLGST